MAIETISRHHMYLCGLVMLVIISANLVQGVFVESLQKPCDGKKTCHECIQTKGCAWCAQPGFGERCFQKNTSPLTGTCEDPFIFSPNNEQIIVAASSLTRRVNRTEGHSGGGGYEEGSYQEYNTKGRYSKTSFEQESHRQSSHSEFNSNHRQTSQSMNYGSYEESGKIVQIYPQRVSLKLRLSKFHRNVII